MKLENFFELSYCINLDERTDRWALCQGEFEKIKFYPERFSAIKNNNGAMGCLLSHIEILKIANERNKHVLIFEDDVFFLDNAKTIIESALDELINMDWKMFYLGGNILKPFYQRTNHLAELNHCQSTHAYAINKNYVKPILEFLEASSWYIDVLYADGVVPLGGCFITVPMAAIQRSDYSTIEKRIMTYEIPQKRYDTFFVPLTK